MTVVYCSVGHQKLDWKKTHKAQCMRPDGPPPIKAFAQALVDNGEPFGGAMMLSNSATNSLAEYSSAKAWVEAQFHDSFHGYDAYFNFLPLPP